MAALAAITSAARAQESGALEGAAINAGRQFDINATHGQGPSVLAAPGLTSFAPSGLSRSAADISAEPGRKGPVPGLRKLHGGEGGELAKIGWGVGVGVGFVSYLVVAAVFVALSVATVGLLPLALVIHDGGESICNIMLPTLSMERGGDIGERIGEWL